MADKTLKLKATFDTAEVGKGADKAVKEINRVAAAGEAAAVKTEIKRAKMIRGLGALEQVTGLVGAESAINLVRSLPTLIAGLSAATIGAGVGIAASLVPIIYAFQQVRELYKVRKEALESLVGAGESYQNHLSSYIQKSIDSGSIERGSGNDLKQRSEAIKNELEVLNARQKAGTLTKAVPSVGPDGRVSSKIVNITDEEFRVRVEAKEKEGIALLAELKKQLRAEAATRASAAEMAAADELQISKKGFDYRGALLKESLDRGLISQQTYYAETSKLIDQETAEHQAALAVREQNLRAKLAREKDDLNARTKTQAELNQVLNEEELARLDAINKKEAARIAMQAAIASVHKFTLAPTGADELSKLGLFRGGAGDNFPSLQLDALKSIDRKFDDLHALIRTR